MRQGVPPVLAFCDRVLGGLARVFALAASVGIVVLLGVTVTAVIWRYGLNAPIYGIEDISVLALTVVAGGAVAYGARHEAHVSIDLIGRYLGPKVTRLTDPIMRILTAGIAFLAAYALVTKACGLARGCITGNLALEHAPFYYGLAAALFFYGCYMALQFLLGLFAPNNGPVEATD